jgi:signal transduction histidine kinase
MKIRTRLTLIFSIIVGSIIILLAGSVYYFSSNYRVSEYETRLKNRGLTTAKLLVDVREIDSVLLRIIDKNTRYSLYEEEVIIFNHFNKVIYQTTEKAQRHKPTRDFIDRIRLEGEIGFQDGNREGVGFLYTGKFDRFVVVVTAFDIYGKGKLKNLRWILLLGLVFSVGIAFAGGWVYSGQVLKPVTRIIGEVEQITASSLNKRLEEGNKHDELARLSITFNNMLSRLEKAFEIQKTFVSNASHELRTPLTAIAGQIEVTLKKDRESAEYKELLNSLMEDITNLSVLSNNLLSLAQASTDISFLKTIPVRMDELTFIVREELLHIYPDAKINIQFTSFPENEESFVVVGSEDLLKSAIFNLMENACKYSPDKSVEVWFSFPKGSIAIEFVDTGIGIPESEIEKIKMPFYRASNTSGIKGHGLGLSLTVKIAELHGGRLTIESREGMGSRLTISLPTQSF